jgi:hypothetical protein
MASRERLYAVFSGYYPRLSVHGGLIVDDYGVGAGARQAMDEFFANQHVRILF